MNPNSLFPDPTYITKFLHVDQKYAVEFSGLCASILPANIARWKEDQTLTPTVKNNCHTFLIDPVTHHFTYEGYLNKTTYANLPYAPNRPLSARSLLSEPEELTQFTRGVIEFQRDMGVGILIAPYFYVRDLDDVRLVANTRMVSEAARLRAEMNLDLPLYSWICIGAIILQSPAQVNEIVNIYSGLPVEGFMITVENFDDRYVSAEALMGLARLAERLQNEHDLVICSIASFGQVLTALGANGFSAGIGWLETFREVTLQPGQPTFAADRVPRAAYYYIPELLSYVHPDDLQAIYDVNTGSNTMREHYLCHCPACQSGYPQSSEDKKRHFMFRRHEEMRLLSSIPQNERPIFMRQRLELALELTDILEEEALVRIPSEHFVRWIAIIDALTASRGNTGNDNPTPDLNDIIHILR